MLPKHPPTHTHARAHTQTHTHTREHTVCSTNASRNATGPRSRPRATRHTTNLSNRPPPARQIACGRHATTWTSPFPVWPQNSGVPAPHMPRCTHKPLSGSPAFSSHARRPQLTPCVQNTQYLLYLLLSCYDPVSSGKSNSYRGGEGGPPAPML